MPVTPERRRTGGQDVRLRVASIADAGPLAELAGRLFKETYEAANTVEDMTNHLAAAFSERRHRVELADETRVTWIAESGSAQIGYATVRRGARASGVAFERPAELLRIYVDRSWFGRGVGDLLMRACIDQARGWSCDGIWLGVWQKNPRAIAFYQRMQFTIVGSTTFTLGSDVQDDYIMAQPLDVTTQA